MPTVDEQGQQRYFQRVITPVRWTMAQALSPGRAFFVIGAPTGHSQPPAPAKSNRKRQAGKPSGSLTLPRRVRRQAIPRRVLGFGRTVRPWPSKHSE